MGWCGVFHSSSRTASRQRSRGIRFRATRPRLRYDQLMNVGWKRLIPLGLAVVLVNAVVGMLKG